TRSGVVSANFLLARAIFCGLPAFPSARRLPRPGRGVSTLFCLFISFQSSSFRSNTTIGIVSPAAADFSPAPPPRKKYPARRCPDAAAPHGPVSRTAAADSAARVARRCEFPAAQSRAASPAQSKSNLPVAAVRAGHLFLEILLRRSSKTSLIWLLTD